MQEQYRGKKQQHSLFPFNGDLPHRLRVFSNAVLKWVHAKDGR